MIFENLTDFDGFLNRKLTDLQKNDGLKNKPIKILKLFLKIRQNFEFFPQFLICFCQKSLTEVVGFDLYLSDGLLKTPFSLFDTVDGLTDDPIYINHFGLPNWGIFRYILLQGFFKKIAKFNQLKMMNF